MVDRLVAYLGPEGSFTYAAALGWATHDELVPVDSVGEIVAGIALGRWQEGVIAIENSVEGYVAPSLDALIGADDVVAIDQRDLPIAFDAFVLPGETEPLTISAHPHGLAQCRRFVAERELPTVAASSNAAACRDLRPGGIALGPRVCGELYGLETLETDVQDFSGARTRFLRLARRAGASSDLRERHAHRAAADTDWNTMVALTPTITGPGVLARITVEFGRRGVNMSSLVTRPLKALSGRYVFVITCEGVPWEPALTSLFDALLLEGDFVKTLGVFPAVEDLDAMVDPARIPAGSVSSHSPEVAKVEGLLW